MAKFQTYELGTIGISTITLAELKYGAYKSKKIEQNILALEQFVVPIEVLNFDSDSSDIYGQIRADLEYKRKTIGALDLLIAAHALSQDWILVTNNVKEFERLEGLRIENWIL